MTLLTGVHVDVPAARRVELHPGGRRLAVDRVVTLPVLEGPAVEGLPRDARGSLPVDRNRRVNGVEDVYVAGDTACFPIKQGGLACQRADAAAEAIAARAGADIEPEPYAPVLRGILLTERPPQGAIRRPAFSGACAEVAQHERGRLWRYVRWREIAPTSRSWPPRRSS